MTPVLKKKHQSPLSLPKDLYYKNENKKDAIVNFLNESLIDLRNSINSKEILENENQKKNIFEKICQYC